MVPLPLSRGSRDHLFFRRAALNKTARGPIDDYCSLSFL